MYAAPTGPTYYGPAEYQLPDGRHFRNLLGDVDNIVMYQRARQKPNLSAYSIDFWDSQLMTDCPPHMGYTLGSQVYTAQGPGQDGSYHQTDAALYKIDRDHYTLNVVLILEGKPQGFNRGRLRHQATRDAKETVETHGYMSLHVVTTIDTSFHAWIYNHESGGLESLFDEPWRRDETYLDAHLPQASAQWFHLMVSIRANPAVIRVHPSLVLSSSHLPTVEPSEATNTSSFPTSSIQISQQSALASGSSAQETTYGDGDEEIVDASEQGSLSMEISQTGHTSAKNP